MENFQYFHNRGMDSRTSLYTPEAWGNFRTLKKAKKLERGSREDTVDTEAIFNRKMSQLQKTRTDTSSVTLTVWALFFFFFLGWNKVKKKKIQLSDCSQGFLSRRKLLEHWYPAVPLGWTVVFIHGWWRGGGTDSGWFPWSLQVHLLLWEKGRRYKGL